MLKEAVRTPEGRDEFLKKVSEIVRSEEDKPKTEQKQLEHTCKTPKHTCGKS